MEQKKKIIVLTGSGHAKQIIGTLLRLDNYDIIGFLDDDEKKTTVFGVPRIGKIFPVNPNLDTKLIALGIGHVGKTATRKKIIQAYKDAGYMFETIISPTAVIVPYGVEIGEGTYIGDLAVIQPDVKIGKYAIINNSACINHEVTIGDNTHVAPGAMVSGNVSIGKDCMIGTGSAIMQGAKIGDDCLIGMGVSVVKHCKSGERHSMVKLQ